MSLRLNDFLDNHQLTMYTLDMDMKRVQSLLSEVLETEDEKRKLNNRIGLCRNIDVFEIMGFDYLEITEHVSLPPDVNALVFSVVVLLNTKYLIRATGSAFLNRGERIENVVFDRIQLLGTESISTMI